METNRMTATEAIAELRAVGCEARLWIGRGLSTIYVSGPVKAEIWIKRSGRVDAAAVWRAVAAAVLA